MGLSQLEHATTGVRLTDLSRSQAKNHWSLARRSTNENACLSPEKQPSLLSACKYFVCSSKIVLISQVFPLFRLCPPLVRTSNRAFFSSHPACRSNATQRRRKASINRRSESCRRRRSRHQQYYQTDPPSPKYVNLVQSSTQNSSFRKTRSPGAVRCGAENFSQGS